MREQFLANEPARERDYARQYEDLILTVNKGESLKEARRALVEHAEYGKWDLVRTRLYLGGSRKYWLRRRILRVEATV
jgi:hypothetical protein